MSIVPKSRPNPRVDQVRGYLKSIGLGDQVVIIGARGYYRDSMGVVGANDFGIYDDAFAVVSPNGCVTFNGNTDPSVKRPRVAVLRAGVWTYKLGIHGLSKPPERRYRALVQADEVTVDRWQAGPDTGWFGINIHKGSYSTTSSEGCQTVHPDQWTAFFALVESEMTRAGQKTIKYVLLEHQG